MALPFKDLSDIYEKYDCRELQINQLAHLFSPCLPAISTLVVHGSEATGKTSIVKSILARLDVTHAIVHCRECITSRHLLEKTITACWAAVASLDSQGIDLKRNARCETYSALTAQLQRLLQGRKRFILVLDGIDQQQESAATLLPALPRLHETISNLSIVLIVAFPLQRLLQNAGVPHMHFPPYHREEALRIVCRDPPPIFTDLLSLAADYHTTMQDEDNQWLWKRFCAAVWDSLAQGAARDIVSFRALADQLWRPFVASINDGTSGTRDFSKLMVANRALFQDDGVLAQSIVPKSTSMSTGIVTKASNDLPYYSKYLLCAGYLASYNPSRTDALFFMRNTERKRKRNGGGTRAGRPAKHRKISRRLLSPSPFSLERMLAIFHAILPHAVVTTADVYTQIATLTSLRLLSRPGISANSDVLHTTTRWRVNVGWEYIVAVARGVGFEITDYVAT